MPAPTLGLAALAGFSTTSAFPNIFMTGMRRKARTTGGLLPP
ncbi:MAG: hypothetical protein OEU92_04720 [Alphaproteobacteria bacterium]|nr:hypothetical protein [Alphaproteobacteria bacterium]